MDSSSNSSSIPAVSRLLTERELRKLLAARGLPSSRFTLYRHRIRQPNPLPWLRVGGRIVYDVAAVESWLTACTIAGPAKTSTEGR